MRRSLKGFYDKFAGKSKEEPAPEPPAVSKQSSQASAAAAAPAAPPAGHGLHDKFSKSAPKPASSPEDSFTCPGYALDLAGATFGACQHCGQGKAEHERKDGGSSMRRSLKDLYDKLHFTGGAKAPPANTDSAVPEPSRKGAGPPPSKAAASASGPSKAAGSPPVPSKAAGSPPGKAATSGKLLGKGVDHLI
jgi:hypothetical protein